MSYVERHTVTLVTDASGAAIGYTPVLNGRIHAIQYVKAGSSNYADGVDFTIIAETTGQSLWTDTNINASETVFPRFPTHDGVGAASLYAAGGEPVEDHIAIAQERVKITIADGGDTKTGTFYITVV
jgi:hypothetical protein